MAGRVLQSFHLNSLRIPVSFSGLSLSLSLQPRVFVVLDFGCSSVMEPYMFPECLICQVHPSGYPLRRGSLFCVCLAIPATAAVPGLSFTLTYSCPTGCSETDTQELQREAGHSLSSPTFNSQAAAAADGLWRLNHSAHGSYCGPPIVKFKRSSIGSRLNWCSERHLPYMNCIGDG